MELISVIIPVYNIVDFLPVCMQSVLQQSYKNLEILLIDDGSDDGSEDLCDDYARQDERVHVVHRSHHGVASARNKALDRCTGTYLCFVDGDDFLATDMIDRLYETAQQENADIAYCQCQYFDAGKGPVFIEQEEKPVIVESPFTFLSKKYDVHDLQHQTALWGHLFKKELFKGTHFPDLQQASGTPIWPYVCWRADRIAECSRAGYYYRRRFADPALSGTFTEAAFLKKEVMERAVEGIHKYYPYLLPVVETYYYYVLRQIIEDMYAAKAEKEYPKEAKRIQRIIKNHVSDIILSPYISKKGKLSFIIFSIHLSLYVRCVRYYRKRHCH